MLQGLCSNRQLAVFRVRVKRQGAYGLPVSDKRTVILKFSNIAVYGIPLNPFFNVVGDCIRTDTKMTVYLSAPGHSRSKDMAINIDIGVARGSLMYYWLVTVILSDTGRP